MKANEAPEKLYFELHNNLIGLYDSAILGMFSIKKSETAIGYNRTDAFIEKACTWLKGNAYFFVNDYTGSLNEDGLIDEFRKYMKGDIQL